MSKSKTKKTRDMTFPSEAHCPYCNTNITNELVAKIRAGTHTYGAVQFCPKCGKSNPWKFNWVMDFDGFTDLRKTETEATEDFKLPAFTGGEL